MYKLISKDERAGERLEIYNPIPINIALFMLKENIYREGSAWGIYVYMDTTESLAEMRYIRVFFYSDARVHLMVCEDRGYRTCLYENSYANNIANVILALFFLINVTLRYFQSHIEYT